jgi:hypothetical protein
MQRVELRGVGERWNHRPQTRQRIHDCRELGEPERPPSGQSTAGMGGEPVRIEREVDCCDAVSEMQTRDRGLDPVTGERRLLDRSNRATGSAEVGTANVEVVLSGKLRAAAASLPSACGDRVWSRSAFHEPRTPGQRRQPIERKGPCRAAAWYDQQVRVVPSPALTSVAAAVSSADTSVAAR